MRFLLKIQDKYITIYWVKLTSNNMVTGWCSNIFKERYILPGTERHDFHFYYPIDGNYHTSHKYTISASGKRIEERYYWDHYVIKHFDSDNKFINAEKFEYNSDDPRGLYRPFNEQPNRLDNENIYFQFGMFGVGLSRDFSDLLEYKELFTAPRKGDIVIDANTYKDRNININAQIYNKQSPVMKSDHLKTVEELKEAIVLAERWENDFIYLETHALIFPLT